MLAMKTNLIRRNKNRRGGMVLEAAIVLPVLMFFLIFPAVEWGYMFYVKHTFQGAAREGARMAIVTGSTNAKVRTHIENAMRIAGFEPPKYEIFIHKDNQDGPLIADISTQPTGTAIMVEVRSSWASVGLPKISPYGPSSTRNVLGRTVMRKE